MILAPGIAGLSSLGRIMQIAYVPSNIPAAYEFWTRTMGVGPFFRMPNLRFPDLTVRGHTSTAEISAAIAYWGDMQIEIIEVHDDQPSVYREWRDAGNEGVHHYCITVANIEDARETIIVRGYSIVQEMSLGRGGKVLFVDTGGGPGTMIEILQLRDGSAAMFERWRIAAACWDGLDPIRMASRRNS